jgi:hypothetical protein
MHTTPSPSSLFAAARSDMPTSRRVLSMPSPDQVSIAVVWWMYVVQCSPILYVCIYRVINSGINEPTEWNGAGALNDYRNVVTFSCSPVDASTVRLPCLCFTALHGVWDEWQILHWLDVLHIPHSSWKSLSRHSNHPSYTIQLKLMSHQCACARVFLFAFYVQPSTMLVLMRFCIFYLQLAYFNILKQVAIGCHASAPRRNIGNSTGLGQNCIFARLEFLFIFLNNKLRSFIYIYIFTNPVLFPRLRHFSCLA